MNPRSSAFFSLTLNSQNILLNKCNFYITQTQTTIFSHQQFETQVKILVDFSQFLPYTFLQNDSNRLKHGSLIIGISNPYISCYPLAISQINVLSSLFNEHRNYSFYVFNIFYFPIIALVTNAKNKKMLPTHCTYICNF